MFNIEAYLKNNPVVSKTELETFEFAQRENPYEESLDRTPYYVWRSNVKITDKLGEQDKPYIELFVGQEPIIYEDSYRFYKSNEQLERDIASAIRRGFEIPQSFIDRLRETRTVRADHDTAEVYRSSPQLKSAFSLYEPFWGIISLTGGEPCYNVILKTPSWGPKNDPSIMPKMRGLAKMFASRFDGIVYDFQGPMFLPLNNEGLQT